MLEPEQSGPGAGSRGLGGLLMPPLSQEAEVMDHDTVKYISEIHPRFLAQNSYNPVSEAKSFMLRS